MDSLIHRYSLKLGKSVIDAFVNVLILMVVPRVLGPEGFGNFHYIRDIFQNVVSFCDMNLGSAHSNYASRNADSSLATSIYTTYVFFVGIMLVIVCFILFYLPGLRESVFPGQDSIYIILGALLAYTGYIFQALMSLSDSKGLTVGFETRAIIVTIICSLIFFLIWQLNLLSLKTFFIYRIFVVLLLILPSALYINKCIGILKTVPNPLRQVETRDTVLIFYNFAHPLVALSVCGLLTAFLDRWLLQVISGPSAQGFFSLALVLSTLVNLFLTPFSPLLMQTIASADEEGDVNRLVSSFEVVRVLYLLATFIAIFLAFHAEAFVLMVGGDAFSEAKLTVLVMSLTSMHVVYGQVCGSSLIALKKTSLYRNIAIANSLVGLALTYWLLAPSSFFLPGLELGSVGLAFKIFISQIVAVNIQLFFVCKIIGTKFSSHFKFQIGIPILFCLFGVFEQFVFPYMNFSSDETFTVVMYLAAMFLMWTCLLFFTMKRHKSFFVGYGINLDLIEAAFSKLLYLSKKFRSRF